MFKNFRNWLDERHLNEKKARYRRGWDWAAGICLKNGMDDIEISEYEIESYTDTAKHMGDFNEFDSGAEDALAEYKSLVSGVDK